MKSKMRNMLVLTVILAMFASVFTGCGKGNVQEEKNSDKQSEKIAEKTEEANANSESEVLEFYHGYFHDESEWPAAKAMRDIYDEFAKRHEGESVVFKPIAVENRDDIVSAQVAGGSYPDIVDVGGGGVPYAALSQNLVLDLKPYIDENGLKEAVGINYTQHDIDGHIYAVHDQIESRGLWYNADVLKKAGVSEDIIKDYQKFEEAIPKIQAVGDGTYAYIAGQGSCNIIESILANTESGRAMINSELTEEIINSDEFANAFKTVAKMDQMNGSEHTTNNNGNLMAEFNTNGKVGVLFNGVWNASGIDASLESVINPALFPNDVAIASAGGGISIANGMSEAKTKLALEFVKYMTSKEVQRYYSQSV